MFSLASIRLSNASNPPSYSPTAVFIGGTSGIGRGMAETFPNHVGEKDCTVVIVGRNRSAAEEVFATLPPNVRPEFVECDVTSMKNVKKAATEILKKHQKINYLVISTGIMTMDGFTPTEDGIDRKLAVHYYSRWRFIDSLVPALQRASDHGEDAKVMSVLGPGRGAAIDANDLGLKKSYTVPNAALSAATYNDLMMESFASRYPRLSFTHAHPGFVRTGLASASNSPIFTWLAPLIVTVGHPFSVSAEECGQYMWHGLYNAKQGFSRIGSKGEDIGMKRYFGNEEQRSKLWQHTIEATRVAGEKSTIVGL